ncbi:MAG: flavodoxin FldB [Cellvibrionaceae bacterium]
MIGNTNHKAQQAPIGLFYGSSTCYTEMSAEKIQTYFGKDSVDVFNIVDTPIEQINDYQQLIFGIPTWDYGELQEDWEDIWDNLDEIDFKGKTVALFGLGDQIGYPDWFLDAMGYLHNKVLLKGATIIGYWPNEGYTFVESQALTDDKTQFLGLALDDENQFDQTDERITTWCEQLKKTFVI